MKLFFVLAALCIGASLAEVSHEEQVRHEEMLAELCKETGIFPNPHDPEGRTFIRCELEPVELRCDDGFIFDAEKLMCVEEPKPEPVDMDKVDWMKVLKCPNFQDKYYRNPYDCHRFYRCYTEGHFERIGLGQCVPSMIFDDVLDTCLPAEQFKSYYGHGCEARALPDEFKPGHEHQNPNPDNHEGEHEHEHQNPDPDNHEGEHEHEHQNPDPDNHEGEHEHEHQNPDPDNHEGEHEHEHQNPDPDNHEGEHEHEHQIPDPDNHEGEHEEEHKHEPEPEKVPSLKDILKEIQDLFNKKH